MQKKCVKYITPKIMDRIRHFIDKLSREVSTPELTNVYSPEFLRVKYVGKICITTFKESGIITVM